MTHSHRLDSYIELEKDLSILMVHYEICEDMPGPDVLDWAKMFLQWSRRAEEKCGAWSRQNLDRGDRSVADLSAKPKAQFKAYFVLGEIMGEAAKNLESEILGFSSSMVQASR